MLSFLHAPPFARHTIPANPIPESKRLEQELRDALLKCASLTEAEVDAYIAYEYAGIVYEDVPLDCTPVQPDEEISCLYADGILQAKTLRRHTNQIAPETLAKVQRVLPELFDRPYPWSSRS